MNNCIAFGAYLIGLSAHILCVKATVVDEFRIDLDGVKKERGQLPDAWKVWERETKIRVRGALTSLGIDTGFAISFDHAPKVRPQADLAIIAACLGAIGKLPSNWFAVANHNGAKIFLGELSLQGHVRPTRGVLPVLVDYSRSRKENDIDERQFVVPYDCANEASYANTETNIYAIAHVSELFDLPAHTVAQKREYRPIEPTGMDLVRKYNEDLPRKLPERVVRAIEIAAIGRHRIAFIGERSFKAARLLSDLLPPMTREEALESASLHSIAGLLRNEPNQIGIRPFRAPHHTVSERGLVGGGDPIRCGEVSLAHNGVLYLDALPEFKRGAIEQLATCLRLERAIIRRMFMSADFPAKPLLVTGCPQRCPCDMRDAKGNRRSTHSDFCTEERRKEWQSRHVETLGIEMIVDTDFADGDRPCSEDTETLRRWVACAIEFGKRNDLATAEDQPHGKLARTIANREGHIGIFVKDFERAVALSA